MSDVFHHDVVTARKTHTCVECDAPIDKGERYLHWHGIYDGEPYSERLCLFCYQLALLLMRENDDEHAFGELWSEVREKARLYGGDVDFVDALFPRCALSAAERDARYHTAVALKYPRGSGLRGGAIARRSLAMREAMRWRREIARAA